MHSISTRDNPSVADFKLAGHNLVIHFTINIESPHQSVPTPKCAHILPDNMMNSVSRAVSDVHDGSNSDDGTPGPPSTWSDLRKNSSTNQVQDQPAVFPVPSDTPSHQSKRSKAPSQENQDNDCTDKKGSVEFDTFRAAEIMTKGFSENNNDHSQSEEDAVEVKASPPDSKNSVYAGDNCVKNDSNEDLLYDRHHDSSKDQFRPKPVQDSKNNRAQANEKMSPQVQSSPLRNTHHSVQFQLQQHQPQSHQRVVSQQQHAPGVVQMLDQNGQVVMYTPNVEHRHQSVIMGERTAATSGGHAQFMGQHPYGAYHMATPAAMSQFPVRQPVHQQALPVSASMRLTDGATAAVLSHPVAYPHPMQQPMYAPANGQVMMYMQPSSHHAMPMGTTAATIQQFQGQPHHPVVDAFGNRIAPTPSLGPNGSVVWYQPQTQYVPVVQMPMQAAYIAQQPDVNAQGNNAALSRKGGSKRKQSPGVAGSQIHSSAGKKQTKPRARGHNRKCWLCVAFGKTNEEKSRIQMKWNPAIDKLVWTDGHGDNFCPSLNGRATVEQAAIAKKAWSQARSKRSPYRKYLESN